MWDLYFGAPESACSTLLSWNLTPFYVGLYQLLSASIIFSSLAQSQNASQKQIREFNLEIYIQFYKWKNKRRLTLLNNWSKSIVIRYSWDNWLDFGHARSKNNSTSYGHTLSPPELHGITDTNTSDYDQRTNVNVWIGMILHTPPSRRLISAISQSASLESDHYAPLTSGL